MDLAFVWRLIYYFIQEGSSYSFVHIINHGLFKKTTRTTSFVEISNNDVLFILPKKGRKLDNFIGHIKVMFDLEKQQEIK